MTGERALIFAAGRGTRMKELTQDKPKALIEVGGKPLIDHMMDYLEAGGIRDFVVNVHHFADKLEAHLASQSARNVTLSDERGELLETGGGFMKARHLLPRDKPVFIVNSDIIFQDAYEHGVDVLRQAWNDEDMDCLLLLVPKENAKGHQGAGDFFMDEQGRLTLRGDAPSAPYIFSGLRLFHPRLARGFDLHCFSFLDFFHKALANGRLYGVPYSGRWVDVGTREALNDAQHLI